MYTPPEGGEAAKHIDARADFAGKHILLEGGPVEAGGRSWKENNEPEWRTRVAERGKAEGEEKVGRNMNQKEDNHDKQCEQAAPTQE